MQVPENRNPTHHLFILDESASMQGIQCRALDALEDTMNAIRLQAIQNGDTHRITALSFNGRGIRQHAYDQPVDHITTPLIQHYLPDGTSPLMDCLGVGIGLVQAALKKQNLPAKVVVTIVTDGADNGSCKYCPRSIASMIRKLKTTKWTFHYIGANHDVKKACATLGIDHYFIIRTPRNPLRREHHLARMARQAYHDAFQQKHAPQTIQAA